MANSSLGGPESTTLKMSHKPHEAQDAPLQSAWRMFQEDSPDHLEALEDLKDDCQQLEMISLQNSILFFRDSCLWLNT